MSARRLQDAWDWALYSVLFLFFFQLISDFVEAIYAFGLLGTSIPVEIVCVLFFFSPVLLLFVRRGPGRMTLGILAGLMLVSRLVEPLLDTRGRMLASGLGVSCFMLLFPGLLYGASGDPDHESESLGAGLAGGVAGSILLRALDSGSDLSTHAGYQAIAWVLALVAGGFLYRRWRASPSGANQAEPDTPAHLGKVAGLSVGLAATLVLLYFAFTSPTVIARWTGASYLLVLGIAFLGLVAFSGGILPGVTISSRAVWALNLVFLLSLVFTILPYQISFSADPGAYPLSETQPPALAGVPLVLMLVLFPVVLLDFTLLAREMLALRPTGRLLGAGFSLAALFILVMVFAQVFTTVYDYIPVVGPFFRDRFWLVFLTVGAAMILPLLLVKREALNFQAGGPPLSYPAAVILMGAASLMGTALTQARPAAVPPDGPHLRLLTYNVQQGYSATGQKNFDGQIRVIRAAGPDVIGLQESDTSRIAGGNADLVRYFADRLGLYSYYGPKTVTGTFGIALLSRYPIQNPSTFFMYSRGEQTATIQAQVVVEGKTFNLFVTHLGNGGPIFQQLAILKETAGKDNVVLMGDFNFRPNSEQYRLTREQLDDAWLLRWPAGTDNQGFNPEDSIDHVFVSAGTQVTQAEYLLGPASDHPAVLVEIEW